MRQKSDLFSLETQRIVQVLFLETLTVLSYTKALYVYFPIYHVNCTQKSRYKKLLHEGHS